MQMRMDLCRRLLFHGRNGLRCTTPTRMVSMDAVRELRKRSGAGIAAVRNALADADGDMDRAQVLLREQGAMTAARKSEREASHGLVGCFSPWSGSAAEGTEIKARRASLVQLRCETDFVARNERFRLWLRKLVDRVSEGDSSPMLTEEDPWVANGIAETVAAVGENVRLGAVRTLEMDGHDHRVVSYVHSAIEPGIGQIGVLVAIRATWDPTNWQIARHVAMHVAAMAPTHLRRSGTDGNPSPSGDEESALENQIFVADESGRSVREVMSRNGMEITSFVRVAASD